ncbi:hypothetical protein ACRAWD_06605 [Caulobacter segnis]
MSDEHLSAPAPPPATRRTSSCAGSRSTRSFTASDLLSALVFTALWAGTAARTSAATSIRASTTSRWTTSGRPLTVRQVADSLGLPYETVRRRFIEMLQRGVIRRAGPPGASSSRSRPWPRPRPFLASSGRTPA